MPEVTEREEKAYYITFLRGLCPICRKEILTPSILPESIITVMCSICGEYITAITYITDEGSTMTYVKPAKSDEMPPCMN